MGTEWIKLYDKNSQDIDSSWLRSVGWNDGDLILRIYDDDPENPRTVRYNDLDEEIFEDLKEVYEKNGSVGSAVNEKIIQNKDIDPAHTL
jgi:Fe-S-cluster formation regulator IscX/YfhJ